MSFAFLRGAMNRVAVFVALPLLALAACGQGGEKQAVEQPTPTVDPSTAAPNAASTSASTDTATSDAPTEPPPEQVSETGEALDEAPDASATTSAPLRLSSAIPDARLPPSAFKEGVHYQRLVPVQPTLAHPGQIEVVEFFSYGCARCFAIDPRLDSWALQSKAALVAVRRVPIVWGDAQRVHARAFYTAEQLGKMSTLHSALFREVQLAGNSLAGMDAIKAFFTANGVTKADFDKAFNSQAVEQRLLDADQLGRRMRVSVVPFFVINGKYTTDAESAGGDAQLLQLMSELTAREQRGL